MLISRPFFYSGGIFVELAGGVRHSSDCCPERHEKPGCCRCPGTLKAVGKMPVLGLAQRHTRSFPFHAETAGRGKGKMTNRGGRHIFSPDNHEWLKCSFLFPQLQWESSVGIVATWKATVMSREILSVDKALMFSACSPRTSCQKMCLKIERNRVTPSQKCCNESNCCHVLLQ